MNNRLEKQIDFIMEIDRLKKIKRQTYLSDASEKEDDAQHSWHLAVMAMLLSEYAQEKVDILKVIKLVLIHDVIEIDAGDTYAYDEAGNATKAEREKKAAKRIFGLLPEDQEKEWKALWEEFEEGKTPEAKFSAALDKVQPILLNDASGGKSWEEHHVKKSQVVKRNARTKEGSKVLWDYVEGLLEKNVKKGVLGED